MPKDNLEDRLRGQGFRYIIGLDEAGRGALAGPVVAVAVLIKFKIQNAILPASRQECKIATKSCAATSLLCAIQDLKLANSKLQIQDSKKLSAKKREEIFEVLKSDSRILWGRGLVQPQTIDKINILEATKLAMRRAVYNLEKKLKRKLPSKKTVLIIDGNQKIETHFLELPIVKADNSVFLCSCASIIAKVERDSLMRKYHKRFPQYNFSKHKGYPTVEHREKIKAFGASKLHRRTFWKIESFISCLLCFMLIKYIIIR